MSSMDSVLSAIGTALTSDSRTVTILATYTFNCRGRADSDTSANDFTISTNLARRVRRAHRETARFGTA